MLTEEEKVSKSQAQNQEKQRSAKSHLLQQSCFSSLYLNALNQRHTPMGILTGLDLFGQWRDSDIYLKNVSVIVFCLSFWLD